MKKVLFVAFAFVIVLLMVFSSCSNTESTSNSCQSTTPTSETTPESSEPTKESSEPVGSKETTNDSTEFETSKPDESTSDVETTIDYTDKNIYEAKTVDNGDGTSTLYYLTYQMNAPEFTTYYHNYQAAVSFTFDDGYNVDTGKFVTDLFKVYDFHGTAMLGPCFLSDSLNNQWRQVFAEGYLDCGCHGYDHLNPVGLDPSKYEHEIKDAFDYLKAAFPDQNVLTFATPLAHIDDSYENYLKNYCLSDRLEADGFVLKLGSDVDMYRIKAYSFNKGQAGAQLASITANIDKNIEKGRWATVLCHCVLDNPVNSTDVSKEDFSTYCKYLYDNYNGKVWFASFEQATIYHYQLKNAKINYKECDAESMTFNVTCDLDENIFNIPMSATIYVPSFVSTAYAVIDGVEQDLEVTKSPNGKSVTVLDIPVNGSDVKIYLGEDLCIENGCDHDLVTIDTVEPTCSSHGYTLKGCSICGFTYKTRITRMSNHDFTGEVEIIVEPSSTRNGYDLIHCKNCSAVKKEITTWG